MGLSIRVLRDAPALRTLAPDWEQLLTTTGHLSICLTPAWLTTWWDIFAGPERELCAISVWDGRRLVGFAPLQRTLHRYYGVIPFPRIAFLGTGEPEAEEVCSEYLDLLAVPGAEAPVADAVWKCLGDATWDEMVLAEMPEGSPMLSALLHAVGATAGVPSLREDSPATVLPLRGGWDDLLSGLGPSTRYRIRRALREFEQHGKLLEVTQPAEFDRWFDRLACLHQARWAARGKPGAFATERFRAFHRRFAALAMPRGWVRLLFLEWDGELVAGHYLFEYANRLWFYQAGIRPFPIAGTGPGMLLHALAIRDAAARGLGEYDFLKGVAGHKRQWSRTTRRVVTARWTRGRLRERLLAGARWTAQASRPIRRLTGAKQR